MPPTAPYCQTKIMTGYLHLKVNERLSRRLCSSIVDDVNTFLYELDTELLQIIHIRPPSESMQQVLVLLAGYIARQDHYDANRKQSSPVRIWLWQKMIFYNHSHQACWSSLFSQTGLTRVQDAPATTIATRIPLFPYQPSLDNSATILQAEWFRKAFQDQEAILTPELFYFPVVV